MNETVDEFVRKLEEQIHQETREAYGDAAYERWLNPSYVGSIEDPDGYASLKGRCGDTVKIYLKFEGDRVKEARCETDGCGSSLVCSSFAAEMALGKSPDEILEVTGEKILEVLGSLPEEESHCAFLAAETLQEALLNFMKDQRQKDTLKKKEA
jgi:nitrogen fixation NifU-like protein